MYDVDEDLRRIYVGNLETVIIIGLISVAVYNLFNFLSFVRSPIPYPTLLGIHRHRQPNSRHRGENRLFSAYCLSLRGGVSRRVDCALGVGRVFRRRARHRGYDPRFHHPVVHFKSGDSLRAGPLLSYTLGALAFGWYGSFFGPIVVIMLLHFGRTVFPQLVENS